MAGTQLDDGSDGGDDDYADQEGKDYEGDGDGAVNYVRNNGDVVDGGGGDGDDDDGDDDYDDDVVALGGDDEHISEGADDERRAKDQAIRLPQSLPFLPAASTDRVLAQVYDMRVSLDHNQPQHSDRPPPSSLSSRGQEGRESSGSPAQSPLLLAFYPPPIPLKQQQQQQQPRQLLFSEVAAALYDEVSVERFVARFFGTAPESTASSAPAPSGPSPPLHNGSTEAERPCGDPWADPHRHLRGILVQAAASVSKGQARGASSTSTSTSIISTTGSSSSSSSSSISSTTSSSSRRDVTGGARGGGGSGGGGIDERRLPAFEASMAPLLARGEARAEVPGEASEAWGEARDSGAAGDAAVPRELVKRRRQ